MFLSRTYVYGLGCRSRPCRPSIAELTTHACSPPPLVVSYLWFYQVQLDRVLDVDEVEGEETRLLVKWAGAPYSECTYELVKDLKHAGQVGGRARRKKHTNGRRFLFSPPAFFRGTWPAALLRYNAIPDGVLSCPV